MLKKTVKKYLVLGLVVSFIAEVAVTIFLISNPEAEISFGDQKVDGVYGALIMIPICLFIGIFNGILFGLISFLSKLLFDKIYKKIFKRK